MALAAPEPNRSSWATAQGSHYTCGVLALRLLHTAVLGVQHQLPLTVQSTVCKDTAKEKIGGGWVVLPAKNPERQPLKDIILILYCEISLCRANE